MGQIDREKQIVPALCHSRGLYSHSSPPISALEIVQLL